MKHLQRFLLISLAFALLLSAGCAKKVDTTKQAVPVEERTTPVPEPPREPVQREEPPTVSEEPVTRQPLPATLEPIFFDFDKSNIREDARQILVKNVEWLRANPDIRLTIEGHCDERGTNEYNLALGQRRADAAKRFLVAMGIDAARLRTVSYGEERPFCTEHHEGCWSKNRRAQFVVESR